MKKFLLVLVFAVSFVIKATTVFGAEVSEETKAPAEKPAKAKAIVETLVPQTEESDKSTETDGNSSEMKIQNNITFGQVTSPIEYIHKNDSSGNTLAPEGERASGKNNNSSSMSAEIKSSPSTVGIALIPMGGGTVYQGRWNNHIRNNYTLGVALELSIIPLLSLEAEVAQGRYYISYSGYGHNFTQYTYGGSAKFYLTRGVLQTYLGGGILGITYQNMTYGMDSMSTYDRTVGAGQAIAGAEIVLSNNIALGVRGSYIVPLFNRPRVMSGGGYAYPSYEEFSAMNTAMYRLMGSVKISL